MLVRWSRLAARRNHLTLQASRLSSSPALPQAPKIVEDSETEASAKLLFTSKPQSLTLPPASKLRVLERQPTGFTGFALRLMGYYHRDSKFLRGARTLHSRVARHVENPALYATFSLEKSFRTTHAMLVLHTWMCLVRLRGEGKDGSDFGQALYEVYNEDLERRVVAAGVKMLFSKWMKELEKIFYGAVLAYDNAMKPEASKDELARALWRNVFAEDDKLMPTGVLAIPVQSLARYVRRETACLALTDKEALLSGNILFSTDSLATSE